MHEDTLRRLFEEMTASFRETPGIPVDIRRGDGTLAVTADLPGVTADRIDVTATADTLTIAATDDQEVAEESETYYRRERSRRRLEREIRLPSRVDPDSADASYSDGVLTVRLALADDAGRDVPVTVS